MHYLHLLTVETRNLLHAQNLPPYAKSELLIMQRAPTALECHLLHCINLHYLLRPLKLCHLLTLPLKSPLCNPKLLWFLRKKKTTTFLLSKSATHSFTPKLCITFGPWSYRVVKSFIARIVFLLKNSGFLLLVIHHFGSSFCLSDFDSSRSFAYLVYLILSHFCLH